MSDKKKKQKQEYLYTQIIEKGFDSADFVHFMQSEREGGNLISPQARTLTIGAFHLSRIWSKSTRSKRQVIPSIMERTVVKTVMVIEMDLQTPKEILSCKIGWMQLMQKQNPKSRN